MTQKFLLGDWSWSRNPESACKSATGESSSWFSSGPGIASRREFLLPDLPMVNIADIGKLSAALLLSPSSTLASSSNKRVQLPYPPKKHVPILFELRASAKTIRVCTPCKVLLRLYYRAQLF